jgi:hypothetical protein
MGIENERSRNLSHLSLDSIPRSIADNNNTTTGDQHHHPNYPLNDHQITNRVVDDVRGIGGGGVGGEVNEKNGEPLTFNIKHTLFDRAKKNK